jgi:hypothetical protein
MSSRSPTSDPTFSSAWPLLVAYSLLVCALHFGGLEYDIYTQLWWWDLLTHSLSGIGVAAWLCLLPVTPVDATRLVAVPLVVLAIGGGFEVYEYLFKDFYVEWTTTYYAFDTVVDLVLDFLGAAAFTRWYGRHLQGGQSSVVLTSEPAD